MRKVSHRQDWTNFGKNKYRQKQLIYLLLCCAGGDWNPHKVELAVWAYYILREHRPELLEDLPDARPAKSDNYEPKQIVKEDRVNGENGFSGEVSRERGAEQNGKTNGFVRTKGDTDEERQASSNGEVG